MARIALAMTIALLAAALAACAGPPGPPGGQPPPGREPDVTEATGPTAEALEQQISELQAANRALQARLEAMESGRRESSAELPSPLPRVSRDVPTGTAMWDDFRNVAWGVSLATRDDMDWSGMEGKTMYRYRRPDDLLAIDQAELSALYYLTRDDRFCGVLIEAEGRENLEALEDACAARFGTPARPDATAGSLRWEGRTSAGDTVTITLNWDTAADKASGLIAFEPLFQSDVTPAARDMRTRGGF
jgi:hypothetical protein